MKSATRSIRATVAGLACLAFIATAGPAAAFPPDTWPVGYQMNHTYYEVGAELTQLAAMYPGIVRLRSIGRSYQGREMWMVKISDNVALDEAEPEIYVEGGIHAYEHTSTEQAMAIVTWLVNGYGTDARMTAIVNSTEIWIAPMVNPDGAMYDISGGTFHVWRKNRSPNPGSTALGTDVNRNFGFKWGCCKHSNPSPASRYYRGSAPWSTPEARNIRDFVSSRIVGGVEQIRLALDLHAHGEFVMYPFAFTSADAPIEMRPADRDRLVGLATGIASRNGYRAVQNGDVLAADGTFMDWAYGRLRIMALTVELAPLASVTDGRYVRDRDLPALLERNRDAMLWFLEQAATA